MVRKRTFILRHFTVFNVRQCVGLTAPTASARAPFEAIAECDRIVTGYGDRPRIDHGGSVACYLPSMDRILLPPREAFDSAADYYSTLYHEMIHATGSASRLARAGVVDAASFASHAYSFEELVAECGAAFLASHAGIACTLDNSAAYIAHWVSRLSAEPRWLVSAAAQASRAADLIIGKQGERSTDAEAA